MLAPRDKKRRGVKDKKARVEKVREREDQK